MDAMEVVAVIILIVAILVIIYYYLLNRPETLNKIRNYVPTTADAHMNEILNKTSGYKDLEKDGEKSDSMTKRIKVKLIKNWSLATTRDLDELEKKFNKTASSVDALDKEYREFKKSSEEFQKCTEEKLADIDKRIEALEK